MNNRIMAALFALTLCLCLFIGVVPVEADAACNHVWKDVSYKAETCTEDGVDPHKECRQCGVWAYVNTTTVCTPQGKASLIRPAKGHNFITDANTRDAVNHWEGCTRCGVKQNVTAHDAEKVEPNQNGSKCKITCSCGYIYGAEHTSDNLLHSEAGVTYHWNECTKCHSRMNGITHTQVTVANEDGKTHRDECKDCGLVFNAKNDHVLKATINADGTHTIECDYCEYEDTAAHVDENRDCICDEKTCQAAVHDYTGYIVKSDGSKHIKACSKCKTQDPKAVWEDHTYGAFESYANGTHKAKCSVCDHISENELRCSAADKNGDHICDDCGGRVGHLYSSTSYMEDVKKQAAKCDVTGIKENHRQCRICGLRLNDKNQVLTDEEMVIPALGHDYVWAKAQENEHYKYCSRKGCNAELLERGAHTITYVQGTGANVGRHYKACEVCGYVATVGEDCADVPGDGKCECKCGYKISHTMANTVLVEAVIPTCTTDGSLAHRHCNECGGNFALDGKMTPMSTIVVKAPGHKYQIVETLSGKHVVTCTNVNKITWINGTTQNTPCSYRGIIGHEDEDGDCLCDLMDATGDICDLPLHTHNHLYQGAVAATCSTAGTEAYWYYAPCGRKFSDNTYTQEIEAPVSTGFADCNPDDWVNEGDKHVSYCKVCGEECDSAIHEDGNGDNRCDVCGFELSLRLIPEVPATCTTAGTKAYYYSDITQRSYWDAEGTKYISNANDKVIKAYGHIDPVTGAGPVCTDNKDGTHSYTCLLCGNTTSPEAHTTGGCFCTACGAGASGAHKATTYAYQAPVCDKDGHEAYAQCSCGKYYTAAGVETTYQKLVIKATGHTWGAEIFNDDTNGKHYAVCEVCGAKNYGEHALSVNDPLSGNYHQMICECGKTKLEMHYDNNGDNVCDEAGCKRDLSGKEVDVYQHESTTVVTGDKNTNSFVNWLTNWLNRDTPSNGGGSSKPQQSAQPSASNGSGSGSDRTPSGSNPGSGSGNGGSGNGGGSTPPANNTTTGDSATFVQQIVSFFNWIISSLGF